MEKLSKLLGKVMAQKKLCKLSKWAMVNSITQNFVNQLWIDQTITWKIENHVYFLKVWNPVVWNIIFIKKKQLLKKINKQLKKMKYDPILDIKIV